MDIDKKLVQESELTFVNNNKSKTLLLNDDGIVELYEEGKLIESKPFSKITVERDYKKLTQEGYNLLESVRYNIYLLLGEDGVYNSKLVDTVDSLEQAQDRVAELQAENGCSAYYEEVLEENKKIQEVGNQDLQKNLDTTEKELQDNIEQVDRAQELKDELETKLDKLYNESKLNESESICCYELYDNKGNKVDNDSFTDYEQALERARTYIQENEDIDYVEVEKLIWYDENDYENYAECNDSQRIKTITRNSIKTEAEEKETIKDKFDLETCIKNHIGEMYHTSILKDVKSSFIEWSDRKYYHLEFFITEPDYQYNPLKTNTIKKWILDTFDIDKNNLEVNMYKQGHYSGGNRVYNINYYLPDNENKLEETTNKELEQRKQDLHQRERQALKDAGDENWENLIGIAKRLPEDVWQEFYKEEEELRCISMIHSILTYTSKDNWNVEYLLNEKYMQSYITELGIEKVKELCEKEVQEYLDNAVIDKDVYTDNEGVSYNTVSFKNENKVTESPEQVPGTEIRNIKDIAPEIPTSEDITKKLSKQEILDLTTLNLNEEQENFLKHLEITEQEIIDAFKDLVQQMKHLQEDKPFMSIEEYVNEILKF